MKDRDLWEIYRRWRAGQSLARIAAGERRERKTVRRYVRGFAELGLVRDGPGVQRQQFYELVTPLLASNTRWAAPATEQWLRHRQELRELINRAKDPLKPKTAYLVLKAKYSLDGSYETFKRLARAAPAQFRGKLRLDVVLLRRQHRVRVAGQLEGRGAEAGPVGIRSSTVTLDGVLFELPSTLIGARLSRDRGGIVVARPGAARHRAVVRPGHRTGVAVPPHEPVTNAAPRSYSMIAPIMLPSPRRRPGSRKTTRSCERSSVWILGTDMPGSFRGVVLGSPWRPVGGSIHHSASQLS